MPLNKQLIDVVFDKGINTKVADHLTLDSNLKVLENRVFNKVGRLDKREGFDLLSNSDFQDTQITNMDALSKFGEDELVMFANSSLYSYSPGVGKWQYKDNVQSAAVELEQIINGTSQQINIDSCHANGIILTAWVDEASDDIMMAIYDTLSKNILNTTYTVTSTGSNHRCLALNNNLFVFYCEGTELKCTYVSSSSPTVAYSVTLSTGYEDVHSDFIYDVTNIGSIGYVFYKGTTAATVQMLSFNTAGEILTNNTITATVLVCLAVNSFTDSTDTSYIALGYRESASLVKAAIYTQTMAVKKAISTLDSTASTTVTKITSAYDPINDSVIFYYQTDDADTTKTLVTTNTIGLTSGTIGTRGIFLRSVGIASRAFVSNSRVYINLLFESDLQATVFTVENSTKAVISTFAKGRAGSHEYMWAPPSVSQLDDGTYSFAINIKGVIRSENATLFSLLGLSLANIDFNGPYLYNSVSINNNMLAIGGQLLSYDGVFITEQGFHIFPEGTAYLSTATTTGYMSDGVYQYVAIYQYVDSKGNIHKSAPSIPFTQTLSGGTSTQKITVRVPTLRITQKTGDRGDCTIELYRTEASGTIFYKVTSIISPSYNDLTVDYVDVVDTLADATIISNEILYTTGGVLDNIGAPSASIITTYKNRVFVAGLEDKNEIRYSKIVRRSEGVSFNEGLSIQCDPKGGDITALAQLDDKLVIFKHSSLFAIVGDGPSDTGEGVTYSEPELISTDVGCVDGNSVVVGPDGLFFKSAKGIYLLDRASKVDYIGAPVEDYNSLNITSSTLLDDTNEIRFTTNSNVILVYNYYFKQWSVFTGSTVDDALIYADVYTAITSDDRVLYEPGDSYKDQDSYVNSSISTGWIRLNGIQGFQRVYRVAVLGYVRSAHWLKMSIYTDYSDTLVQERLFDVSTVMSLSQEYYGDGTYGDAVYGGTDNGVYQFQVHMKQQKCQAIRVVIEDIYENSAEGSGQGADITGITLEVGVKRGQNKLGSSKSR